MGDSTSKTTSTAAQQATSSGTSNGSASQTGATSASTNPWAASMPTISGILNQLNPLIGSSGLNSNQSTALNQLATSAQNGNQYAPAIGSYATKLLNGGNATAQSGNVSGALDALRSQLSPYANGSMVGSNPALKAQLDQAATDATNSINSQFAAAGRDMSGANQQALARGVTAAQAPIIAAQYNADVANQLNAANALYGAGNSTAGLLSGLNQQSLANQGTGVSAAQSALDANNFGANQLLNVGNQQSQIPINNLGLLAQIGIPIAGLGSTSSGTTSGAGSTSNTSNSSASGTTDSSSTQKSSPSLLSQLTSVGGLFSAPAGGTSAIGGLLSLLSDRNAKDDIEQVGRLFDGTPVYRFRYKGQRAFQIGLMAQDVERSIPEAVSQVGGFKLVDYKKATDRALEAA